MLSRALGRNLCVYLFSYDYDARWVGGFFFRVVFGYGDSIGRSFRREKPNVGMGQAYWGGCVYFVRFVVCFVRVVILGAFSSVLLAGDAAAAVCCYFVLRCDFHCDVVVFGYTFNGCVDRYYDVAFFS